MQALEGGIPRLADWNSRPRPFAAAEHMRTVRIPAHYFPRYRHSHLAPL
jgi:hypothetical protein